jgi:hypothetical protein
MNFRVKVDQLLPGVFQKGLIAKCARFPLDDRIIEIEFPRDVIDESIAVLRDLLSTSNRVAVAGSAALRYMWLALFKAGVLPSNPNFEPQDVDTWYFSKDEIVRSRIVENGSDHISLTGTLEKLILGFDLPCCRAAVDVFGPTPKNVVITTYQCLNALLTGFQYVPFVSSKEEYMINYYGKEVYEKVINEGLFKLAHRKFESTWYRKDKYQQRGIVTKHVNLEDSTIVCDSIGAYFGFIREYLRFIIVYYLGFQAEYQKSHPELSDRLEDPGITKQMDELVEYQQLLVMLEDSPRLSPEYQEMLNRDFDLRDFDARVLLD